MTLNELEERTEDLERALLFTTRRKKVDTPLEKYDVANKGYVDSLFSAAVLGRSHTSSGFQGITSGGAQKVTAFNTNDYATGITWDAGNQRFTATKAGKYLVTASLYWSSTASGVHFYTILYKNGAEWSRNGIQSSIAGGVLVTHTADVIALAVNDYVEVYAFTSDSGTENISTLTQSTNFNIVKVA